MPFLRAAALASLRPRSARQGPERGPRFAIPEDEENPSPTSRAARSSPATLRRRLRSGRKHVIVYLHDSQRHKQHHWTLDRLLLMIQHESPVLDDDPDRTFVVGGTRKYLAISTAGAHYFIGQHPLWGEKGKMEGAMLIDNLIFENVRESLEKFYAGRSGEGCFAPYDGRFEFYRPDKA